MRINRWSKYSIHDWHLLLCDFDVGKIRCIENEHIWRMNLFAKNMFAAQFYVQFCESDKMFSVIGNTFIWHQRTSELERVRAVYIRANCVRWRRQLRPGLISDANLSIHLIRTEDNPNGYEICSVLALHTPDLCCCVDRKFFWFLTESDRLQQWQWIDSKSMLTTSHY